MSVRRALLSVSDKKGIVEFARGLAAMKFEILSTGGTAKFLKDNGITTVEVGDYTAQSEILDGRLKTLHPRIHGGLLADRTNPLHMKELKRSRIETIDVLAVNLYPFEQTIAKEGVSLETAIENIDIGGPTMIRAAAKNWPHVVTLVDPADYGIVLEEMQSSGGAVSRDLRFRLAQKVFVMTARYDGAIANYLTGGRFGEFPEALNIQGAKVQDLRYGENPHQKAAFYREARPLREACVAGAHQLHGKELSYNNIMDLDAAIEAVKEFEQTAVVIIKHATPCGAAASSSPPLRDVFVAAREGDSLSAFGGIIAINRPVDADTASEIAKDFYECVVAPAYAPEALPILMAKKNIRLMTLGGLGETPAGPSGVFKWTVRQVVGGLLVQDRDLARLDIRKAKVVTKRVPSDGEWNGLDFAWRLVKHVKSNAIVYASPSPRPSPAGGEGGVIRVVGIGGGQVSRIDAIHLGIVKANSPLKGAVMASDAFFPFKDSIEEAAKAGITAVIQPGGSLKDQESIEAADKHGITMVFTGIRHFRH